MSKLHRDGQRNNHQLDTLSCHGYFHTHWQCIDIQMDGWQMGRWVDWQMGRWVDWQMGRWLGRRKKKSGLDIPLNSFQR
jgi:hypothetical protein